MSDVEDVDVMLEGPFRLFRYRTEPYRPRYEPIAPRFSTQAATEWPRPFKMAKGRLVYQPVGKSPSMPRFPHCAETKKSEVIRHVWYSDLILSVGFSSQHP